MSDEIITCEECGNDDATSGYRVCSDCLEASEHPDDLQRTYSVGSCFAGIGGIDLGFEATGRFETVWHSEISKPAERVLAHRFPDSVALGDIEEISDAPHVDVIVGGPPCQGLSIAQSYVRKGLADKRSALFFTYVELVARVQPKFVVMEQVTGLLSSNGGQDWPAVRAAFEGIGYGFAVVAHNSLAYVPQTRSRLYLVGCRRPDAAARALLPLRADGASDPDAYSARSWQRAAGAGDGAHVFRKGRRPRDKYDGETWVDASYANTLTLFDVGLSRASVIVVDSEGRPRVLTPVEWERCHGFPDDWTIAAGTDRQRWALLGNATSPPVTERIAEGIADAWDCA